MPLIQASPLSPEVSKALADLLKAVTPGLSEHTFFSPEGFKAIAELISAIVWPLLLLLLVMIFYRQILAILDGLTDFEAFGIKGKIERRLDQSAREAEKLPGVSGPPTNTELARASQIARLTDQLDPSEIRTQVDRLAAEYETVRASMTGGAARTRAMEMVVAKMRAIGKAAYALRHTLRDSSSPGRRLQAIACLQVLPDFDLVSWLADRLDKETPFVGYHALVALNVAAASARAAQHIETLEAALTIVKGLRDKFARDGDRKKQAADFEALVLQLHGVRADTGG